MTGATIGDVLAGAAAPHQLPAELHDLWRDGFRAGCNRMQATVYRLERECDRLYYELHNPAEVRAAHERELRAFDIARNRASAVERWAALDAIAAERAEVAGRG